MTAERRRQLAHVALGAAGLAGTSWLATHVGWPELWRVVSAGAGWLLVIFALEGVRIGLEAAATQALIGAPAPRSVLVHAHLSAYPIVLLFPAGRAAGEALKATMLGPHVGLDRAAAAALYQQALPLLAGFAVSLPCVAALAWMLGATHTLTLAVAFQALTAVGLAVPLLVAFRRREVGSALHRVSARLGVAGEQVQDRVLEHAFVPFVPALAMFGNRLVLGVQIITLAVGVSSATGRQAIGVLGAHLVGAAAGDIIPAQIGATDGALALAAEALHVALPEAIAIALLFHTAQLAWAVIGSVAAFRRPQSPTLPHSISQAASEHASKSKISAPGTPHCEKHESPAPPAS